MSIRPALITAVAFIIKLTMMVNYIAAMARRQYPRSALGPALCAGPSKETPLLVEAIMQADPAGVWEYQNVRLHLCAQDVDSPDSDFRYPVSNDQLPDSIPESSFPIHQQVSNINQDDPIASFVFLSTAHPNTLETMKKRARLFKQYYKNTEAVRNKYVAQPLTVAN